MLEQVLNSAKRVIGTKQTIKAIKSGSAKRVFIAKDAEDHIRKMVIDACNEEHVSVEYIDSMLQLGKACGIEVAAAAVAILEDE